MQQREATIAGARRQVKALERPHDRPAILLCLLRGGLAWFGAMGACLPAGTLGALCHSMRRTPEKALLEIWRVLKLTALKLGPTEVPFRRTGIFTELGAKWLGHAKCVANNDSGAVLIIEK